ncbi:hypothetical protein RYX36_036171 [Vicia faba]
MVSTCVNFKTNTHITYLRKDNIFHQDNGFLGERIKVGVNYSPWIINQMEICLKTKERVKKLKHGVVSAVLTSNDTTESKTFQVPSFLRRKADPKKVVSIILGGGPGVQLFPLTKRAATPAVSKPDHCLSSLNRHISRTYFGNGINFGDGYVEVLAATQTPGESGKNWFQGTADAVRQFTWVFEDAKNTNIENVIILPGDHLYRMDYMDLVQQSHIDRNADITVSCAAVGDSRASDYGLVKVDSRGRIIQFSEKPKGADLKAMQVDTSLFGLSPQDAITSPFIASMGVYVFKTDVLLKLLKWRYPTSNDFGSEIIPASVKEYNVQAFFFGDYWEDIGTIQSFYDANMALTEESPMFKFYDPKTPIFTSPRFLPPTKIDKCRIVDAIISHGCFLRECSVQHSIVGERSRLDYGVELKDTIMMGADSYQTESEIASELAEGKVPIGIGRNSKIRKCIIDKNARIGKDVIIMNKDGVQEADRPGDGFYIRSGITIIMEKATIEDGALI